MSKAKRAASWGPAMVLATTLAAAPGVFAAQPWIGVPSSTNGPRVVVAGGALQPSQPVTLQVRGPNGQTTQAAVADAQGKLSVDVATGAKGSYKVEVFDAAGKRLGGGHFVVAQ